MKPLSLDEAKAHLNIDHSDDDVLVLALIDAAVSHLDGYSGIMGRALLTQTWKINAKCFESCMRLPVGNLLSVTSVKYYDASNVQQTLASTVYGAYSDTSGPYIALKYNQSWPSVYTREDAVEITWTAGYGPAATDIPPAIVHAIRMMIGHWYANRETTSEVVTTEIPFAATALLSGLRRQLI